MILFYTDVIDDGPLIIEGDEYTHCCKVLRKKEGDLINVTDGKGGSASAKIIEIKKSKALLEVIERYSHTAPKLQIIMAIAPPKNRSRWEWLVEKSVEIGVDKIIPLRTKNSERIKIKIERSEKIMRSAALQSLRYFHPEITEITNLTELVETYSSQNVDKYLAHYHKDNVHVLKANSNHNIKLILIGPEGDFTPEELVMLNDNNFTQVNLSSNRLRTETAGIIAVNLLLS